jgi:hypothetical protein
MPIRERKEQKMQILILPKEEDASISFHDVTINEITNLLRNLTWTANEKESGVYHSAHVILGKTNIYFYTKEDKDADMPL